VEGYTEQEGSNRAVMGPDTVQDTVLAPAAYWQHFLRPRIDDYWRQKYKPVKSEDTNVVVSVTQCKEPDLLTLVLTGQL
jgi:hypothetical protein